MCTSHVHIHFQTDVFHDTIRQEQETVRLISWSLIRMHANTNTNTNTSTNTRLQ